VQYCEHKPHPILEEAVKCFWTHEGSYSPEQIQPITPDGCIELIFNFGSPYLLVSRTPPESLPPAIIVGFQRETLSISVDGTVKVVAARLHPWGAQSLLQDEVHALTGKIKDLGPSWSRLVRDLEDDVTRGRYEAAWHSLQNYLMQKTLVRAHDAKLVQSAVKFLFRRMKAAGVHFQGEPQVQPYGTGVLLEDLYGNRIYLNQEPR
jgi:hypothetical protein